MLCRSETQSGPESQALLQSLESSLTRRRRHTVTGTPSSIGDRACPVKLRVAVEVRALGTGQLIYGMSVELASTFGWMSARSH